MALGPVPTEKARAGRVGGGGDRGDRAVAVVGHVGGLAVGGDGDGVRGGTHRDGGLCRVGGRGDGGDRAAALVGHIGGGAVGGEGDGVGVGATVMGVSDVPVAVEIGVTVPSP